MMKTKLIIMKKYKLLDVLCGGTVEGKIIDEQFSLRFYSTAKEHKLEMYSQDIIDEKTNEENYHQ